MHLAAFTAILALVLTPAIVAAQRIAPSGALPASARDTTTSDTTSRPARLASIDSAEIADNQVIARIGMGFAGALLGTLAGGASGLALSSGCHGDMCGLSGFLGGVAVGSVAMAALVAAGPTFGSKCSEGGRAAFALGGGLAGAVTGGAIGLIGGPLCILTYIIGGGVGAGVAAASCG